MVVRSATRHDARRAHHDAAARRQLHQQRFGRRVWTRVDRGPTLLIAGLISMPFPRTPALTVDCVAIDGEGRLLLIRRKNPPYAGKYALPGGFVDVARPWRTRAGAS